MGSRWSSPYSSIFIKIILTFFAVVIPMYGIGILLTRSASDSVKDEISTVMLTKVHFYMNTLEAELERIVGLQNELTMDDDLLFLNDANEILTDKERRTAILNLHRKLIFVKNASSYIQNASAYITSIERTISSNSIMDELPEAEMSALLDSKDEGSSEITYWDHRMFLLKKYPEFGAREKPAVLLSLELSRSAIASELAEFIGDDGGGVILLSNKRDWMVEQGGSQAAPQPLTAELGRLADDGAASGIGAVKVNEERFIVTYQKSERLGATLLLYMEESSVLGALKQYRGWYWLLSLLSAIVIVFFGYWMYRMIHKPFNKLIVAFRSMEKGNLNLDIKHNRDDEFKFLYVQFNKMIKRLDASIQEAYVLKYRAQQAELKQLQSQINPHFLYNSFFILSRMIKMQDYDNLMPFANRLGQYFQFITGDTESDVPLHMEVNFSRAYVGIQSVRFENRISARFGEVPDEIKEVKVPRLIIQPMIENAYKHGLEQISRDGLVLIDFHVEPERFIISVQDNGQSVDETTIARLQQSLAGQTEGLEGTGMINVYRRLQLRYGDDAGLHVSRSELGGLQVDITIPYRKEG